MKRSEDRVGALFEAHAAEVKATLRKLGVHGAETDDLLQNVFWAAHRRRAKLPEDVEGAKRWLLDAARKHAANWHRLFRHRYEVLGCDELVLQAVAEPKDPEAYLAHRDLVRYALGRLRDTEIEALVSHHVEGMTLAELGVQLGLTRAAMHVRLRKAEKRMRRMVRRYG